jgi:hypothetical protein
MSDLRAELHTSHLGFFHDSARRASSRAALSATYLADETPFGKRWIFQDIPAAGRIPVGFARPKSRVTPNLDSDKQQYPRFQEGAMVAGSAVCSINVDEAANRPADKTFRR